MSALGIDFGTSNTVAVLAYGGREPRPIMFDGSPLLPSAVCAEPGGRLLTGRDALHTALSSPGGFEPHPKRCIDDRTVLLGSDEIPVRELIAAVLRRVAAEAALMTDEPITETVLTHPAAWGSRRRADLLAAAEEALPAVRLVPEPVAAATFFTAEAGRRLEPGKVAVVYDFGGGTFDASVVRRDGDTFEVLASEGLPDSGGLDVDAAIVERLATVFGAQDPTLWGRLMDPRTPGERRAARQLWDNVRAGKEMLSRSTSTVIHVPLFDAEAPFGRPELDSVATPVIARTIAAVRTALASASVNEADLGAVFLAGGSSRIPLVATVVHRELGVVPANVDQPELAVGEGALRTVPVAAPAPPTTALPTGAADAASPVVPLTSGPAPTVPLTPGPAPATGRRLPRNALPAGVVALFVLAGAGVAGAALLDNDEPGALPSAPPSSAPIVSASPSPSPTPSRGRFTVDPCMIGEWRQVSRQTRQTIGSTEVQLSGQEGVISKYTEGKVEMIFDGSTPETGSANGTRYRHETTGKASAKVYHENGYEYISDVRASGRSIWYRGSSRYSSEPLTLALDPLTYACDGDTMFFYSDDGVMEYTRVKP